MAKFGKVLTLVLALGLSGVLVTGMQATATADDPLVTEADDGADLGRDRPHVFVFAARWGFLDRRDCSEERCPPIRWNGFLGSRVAGVRLVQTVAFERGDFVLPQRNPHLLGWVSVTAPRWDGLVTQVIVRHDASPDSLVLFHTAQWSHAFTLRELADLHLRVPVDRLGHEVEIRAMRLT